MLQAINESACLGREDFVHSQLESPCSQKASDQRTAIGEDSLALVEATLVSDSTNAFSTSKENAVVRT